MKVYLWRLKAPVVNAALVTEQMERARAYRNLLVEIERSRRELITGRLDVEPDVDPLTEEADRRQEQARAIYETERAAGTVNKPSELLSAARKAEAEAWRALKAAKKIAADRPAVAEDIAAIDAEAHRLAQHARATCGLAWGTYQAIEAAHQAACRAPSPPKFVRRGDGSDMVAVHVQNRPLSVVEALGGLDSRVRSHVPPPDAPRGVVRHDGDLGERPTGRLLLRVGSTGAGGKGGDPIWAEWPVKPGQRELPPAAKVVWVKVFRRTIGRNERWQAQITLDGLHVEAPTDSPHVAIAALDVGWRRIAGREGLRVGFMATNGGSIAEITVGEWLLWSAREVDRWHGIRDLSFNTALGVLREWLLGEPPVPEWFAQEASHFGQPWYKVSRLNALVTRWRGERFADDAEIFERMGAWLKQDQHLWSFEANLRDQYLARRKDFYRVFAKRLATSHRVIAMEELDLTKFATADEVCKDAPAAARYYNRLACLSSFKDALKNACRNYGARFVELDAKDTTRTCWDCGHVDKAWDPALELIHRCPKCLRSTDQDEQAARNLLARAEEWWSDPANRSIPAPKAKSNAWAARKAKKTAAQSDRSKNIG